MSLFYSASIPQIDLENPYVSFLAMKFSVTFLSGLVVLAATAFFSPVAHTAESKPNILLIMADDVGSDAIGCYGGQSYPTPNIDALAEGGMKFNHGYSMPVCHPSRVCLMTCLLYTSPSPRDRG